MWGATEKEMVHIGNHGCQFYVGSHGQEGYISAMPGSSLKSTVLKLRYKTNQVGAVVGNISSNRELTYKPQRICSERFFETCIPDSRFLVFIESVQVEEEND